ncbi:hypothetical protein [Paenibacillus prosopidis]|uniref:Sporulation lipoprotein YhcN/YlaJ n=1 Tax=Paenibacillus prosopidis TaxID=630520 RepID=A0A368VLE6_9BACL|nr:hypothetical protein [Paenibacillus prosopidis]RCW42521.1 hypothetical protein DFP97_11683 [Paenibacillus prosopidis]
MNIMKLLVKYLYVTGIYILMILVGCTSNEPVNYQQLIVTPNWTKEQDFRKGTENAGLRTLVLDNDHLPKTFAFHPEIAESILAQHPGIQSAYVLLTEANGYLTVIPDGHNPNSKASQGILNHRVNKKTADNFLEEPEMINQVDWISQSGNLPTRSLEAIGRDAAKYMPAHIKRIYISANPNFFNYLRFYANEEQVRGDLSMYLNQFNMIVGRVFPG